MTACRIVAAPVRGTGRRHCLAMPPTRDLPARGSAGQRSGAGALAAERQARRGAPGTTTARAGRLAGVGRAARGTTRGRWSGFTRRRWARGCRRRACCSSCAGSDPRPSTSTPTTAPPPRRWPAGSRWMPRTISRTTSPPRPISLLDALAPSLIVFSKLDLWPELADARGRSRGAASRWWRRRSAREAGACGGPSAAAARARAIERWPLAAAVSDEDAVRLARLGVALRSHPGPRRPAVRQRGAADLRASTGTSPCSRSGRGAPTLVAGSTWPGDEAVLLAAFARVRASRPDARLILVPHEPTPAAPGGRARRAARGCRAAGAACG